MVESKEMKKHLWLLTLILIPLFSAAADRKDLVGKQFFQRDSRGNDYYYLFNRDGSYTRHTPEVGTEMGNWIVRSDEKGPFIQFYANNMSPSQVRRSPDHTYYYHLDQGVITFYTENTLTGIYFPSYWSYLKGEYAAGTELLDPQKESRFYSHYTDNLYYPQNQGLQNLRWYWSETADGASSGDRFLRVTFPSATKSSNSNRESGSFVKGVVIFNGCFYSSEEYQRRSRLKEGMILFTPGGMKNISLEDSSAPQVIFFNDLDQAVSELNLFINGVYPGSEEQGVCLTKMIFFGIPGY